MSMTARDELQTVLYCFYMMKDVLVGSWVLSVAGSDGDGEILKGRPTIPASWAGPLSNWRWIGSGVLFRRDMAPGQITWSYIKPHKCQQAHPYWRPQHQPQTFLSSGSWHRQVERKWVRQVSRNGATRTQENVSESGMRANRKQLPSRQGTPHRSPSPWLFPKILSADRDAFSESGLKTQLKLPSSVHLSESIGLLLMSFPPQCQRRAKLVVVSGF